MMDVTILVEKLAKIARERGIRVVRANVGDTHVELEMATPREEGPPELAELNEKETKLERIVRKLGQRGEVNADGDDE